MISNDLKKKSRNSENPTEEQNKAGLLKAIAHKDKLIDFDRTRYVIYLSVYSLVYLFSYINSAKRTQVIDDESDYFNKNSKWISQQQRTLLEVNI